MMARPTKSKLLYAQMLGRGTRLHPGKSDLMIVDVVDNSRTHTLPGLYSLFNLPASMNLQGHNVLEVERDIERLTRERPWIDTSRITAAEDIPLAAERIDFFNFDPPAELAGHTDHIWYAASGGYRLNLLDGESLAIESNLLDTWDVRLSRGSGTRLITRAEGLSRAVAIADNFVLAERPDAVKLIKRDLGWRSELPTEKQKELLAKRGISVPEGLTKGQASQMISHILGSGKRQML
jgi:hypothetical protein